MTYKKNTFNKKPRRIKRDGGARNKKAKPNTVRESSPTWKDLLAHFDRLSKLR